MSWSYSPSNMADLDRVRFLIGDTDATDQQLKDEEITALLSMLGGYRWASVYAAEALAAKYSRQVDYRLQTELQEALSQRSEQYIALADRLRDQASLLVSPSWGGESISSKASDLLDADAVKPTFRTEMETQPGTEADYDEPRPGWSP